MQQFGPQRQITQVKPRFKNGRNHRQTEPRDWMSRSQSKFGQRRSKNKTWEIIGPWSQKKTWKKQEETQKIFLSKSITIDCVNFNWRCNWDAWSSHAQTSAACLQKLCPFDRILTATVSSRGHTRALGTHGHKCHTLQAFRGDLTLCLWATKCLRVFAAIHELRRWSFQQKNFPHFLPRRFACLKTTLPGRR